MNSSFTLLSTDTMQKELQNGIALSSSSMVDKQSSGANKLLPLHTRLQEEADKIRRWKIQTEVELKQKEQRLQEANKTLEALRKSVLDLQLQNESLSSRLQEELEQRGELSQRIESTREMCTLLKNFATTVGERIDQTEAEKQDLDQITNHQEKQITDLCEAFHGLELVIAERDHLANMMKQERTKFLDRENEQAESLTQASERLSQLQNECGNKEQVILTIQSELNTNLHKLQELERQYGRALDQTNQELTCAQTELSQIGDRLHEALERETVASEKINQLMDDLQSKSAELAHQVVQTTQLEEVKLKLEQELHTKSLEYASSCQNLQIAGEEKITLASQIADLVQEKTQVEDNANQKISELEKEVETLSSEKTDLLEKLRRDVEGVENVNLKLTDQFNEMKTDKSMIEDELKIARTEVARLKKDIEKLVAKHQENDQCTKEELKKAYSKVEQEQTEKIKIHDDLLVKLSQAQSKEEKMAQDLVRQQQLLQDCEDQLAASLEKQECFADQIHNFTADRKVLEAKIVASREEAINSKHHIEILSEKLQEKERSSMESISALNSKFKNEQESHRSTEDKFKVLLAAANKEADELKMEVKMLTQGKDSAEKQIKSLGNQMAMSLDNYKKGYDEILNRKEKEFDERMQVVNKQNEELKNQLEAMRREKETSDFNAVAESARVVALMETSKWELDAAISSKEGELDEMHRRVSQLHIAIEQKDHEITKMRSEYQAVVEKNERTHSQVIADKDREMLELRKMLDTRKTIQQKSTESAMMKTPVMPIEKRMELSRPRESDLQKTRMLVTVREPPKQSQTAHQLPFKDELASGIRNRPSHQDLANMVTPRQISQSGLLKQSLTSSTRKRKGISFTTPTDESSPDMIPNLQLAAKNSSSQASRQPAVVQRKETQLKPTTPSRLASGSKIAVSAMPSKLAKARKQASTMEWFNNDSIFGFGPED